MRSVDKYICCCSGLSVKVFPPLFDTHCYEKTK